MAKNIIFCADGTWNNPSDIFRLALALDTFNLVQRLLRMIR